jgi:hypothetical protein
MDEVTNGPSVIFTLLACMRSVRPPFVSTRGGSKSFLNGPAEADLEYRL